MIKPLAYMHNFFIRTICYIGFFGLSIAYAKEHHSALDQWSVVSSSYQTNMLELYTSEGCSSCPPADRWLSQWKNHENVFKTFIPVAFHVDYWDHLGWGDPFAKLSHSARQREYRRQGGIKATYTPGFVRNGQEWRGWFLGDSFDPNVLGPKVGRLSVKVDEGVANIDFAADVGTMDIHVVVLGFDLETSILRGENAGRTLLHDFVVLAHNVYQNESTKTVVSLDAIQPALDDPGQKALAFWVSKPGMAAPIQSVGGWLG